MIAHAPDSFLVEHSLVKGWMDLIDTDRAVALYQALGSAVEMSGGSAANTMCGVASFGARAAYIGKVNDDELGEVFGHDLLAVGVQFRPGAYDNPVPTGRCIIVVTPDAERTMNTYLGASSLLAVSDVDGTAVADGRVLYMEGYLYDRPEAKQAFRHAAQIAHEAGRMVSLTLSDSFCVDRHRDDFLSLVDDEVDLLFGNESELMALYQTETFEASIAALRKQCPLAAITIGAKGFDHRHRRRADRGAGRPGPSRGRHHRCRRPLRIRFSVRPDVGRVAGRGGTSRFDRGRRGHQPRRSQAAGRVAYAALNDSCRRWGDALGHGSRPSPMLTSATSCRR